VYEAIIILEFLELSDLHSSAILRKFPCLTKGALPQTKRTARTQCVIFVLLRLMFLGSSPILRHVVLAAIASVSMTIEALEVEVPRVLFA
jgi:hypothetical protein